MSKKNKLRSTQKVLIKNLSVDLPDLKLSVHPNYSNKQDGFVELATFIYCIEEDKKSF